MKVIIAGGRTFNNYELLKNVCNQIIKKDWTIISGCASGADTLAIDYAKEFNINYEEYPADWNLYGKSAGLIRNQQMLNTNATHLIAFWDGKSPGTKNMINISKLKNIEIIVIKYK
jgi:basic membrane lipoprotein Med (substrate-binding protein (PBP1-ABC) superfamily)